MPEGEEPRAPFEVVAEVSVPVEDLATELRQQLRVATDRIAEQAGEITRLRTEVQANMAERQAALVSLREVRAQLQGFRRKVHATAIRVAEEQDWCRAGLNEVLRELELPEHEPRHRVPLLVTATQLIWVEIEDENDADDAVYEAEHNLANFEVAAQVASDDWEIRSWEKAEGHDVETVEPEWN